MFSQAAVNKSFHFTKNVAANADFTWFGLPRCHRCGSVSDTLQIHIRVNRIQQFPLVESHKKLYLRQSNNVFKLQIRSDSFVPISSINSSSRLRFAYRFQFFTPVCLFAHDVRSVTLK